MKRTAKRLASIKLASVLKRRRPEKSELESWLVSDDPAQEALADELFQEIGHDRTLTYLTFVVDREEKARSRSTDGPKWLVLALVVSLTAIYTWVVHNPLLLIPLNILNLFLVFTKRPGISSRQPAKLHVAVLNRLILLNSTRALPTLINILPRAAKIDGHCGMVHGAARLLTLLTTDDKDVLSKEQWKELSSWILPSKFKFLPSDERHELRRSILKACSTVGIREAVPIVKKVITRQPKTLDDEQLQQTARNYLPLLEQAAEQRQMVRR